MEQGWKHDSTDDEVAELQPKPRPALSMKAVARTVRTEGTRQRVLEHALEHGPQAGLRLRNAAAERAKEEQVDEGGTATAVDNVVDTWDAKINTGGP